MANFKNTGDLYVSKSGSDANPGNDPDLPKLTIQGAIDVAIAGEVIVIGDGLYQEPNLNGIAENVRLLGDGVIIVEGNGIDTQEFTRTYIENLIFINNQLINFQSSSGNLSEITDCIILNGNIRSGNGSNGFLAVGSRFINITFTPSPTNTGLNNLDRCILINSTLSILNSASNIITSTLFENSTISNAPSSSTFKFCAFSDNPDLSGFTTQSNLVNNTPLLNRLSGEVETLDFSVQGSSLLLGSGENGVNIGNVRRGLPQTRLSASIQGGTNTNVVFNGNVWQVQAGQTTASIETDVIDFGLTVKSPKLTVKGLLNFLDNVPDFDNALLNPNKLDIEARYAIIGEDISVATYKPFLLNERILLDVSGLSNGEALFDWDNTVTQPMKEIQLRITLRQDYNPA